MIAENYDPGMLRQAVRAALDWPDENWYRYTLKKDPGSHSLTEDEIRTALTKTVQTATDLVKQIAAQYDSPAPQELLQVLDIKLEHTDAALLDSLLVMGLYEPETRTVTLNGNTIALVRQFIVANGLDDLTPANDIIRIALFHEIFHALEEETPDIYTRSRILKRKVLGIFPYRRGIDGLAEVGAVHFSKWMAQVPYSPCIFERYLLLATGRLSIDFLLPNV